MSFGFAFTPGNRATKKAAAAFDPATMSLTGWWRGSFSASPWVGVASAGSSGSRDLTEATNPPSVGTTVNGFDSADFNGTNDILNNATAVSTLVPTAAWFAWCLFWADAVTGTGILTAPYGNEQLWACGGGYVGFALSTAGGNRVQVWQFDGTGKGNEHAISTGAWNLICARYDGTNIKSKLNSGSVSTAASGAYDVATGALRVGCNYNIAAFFNGKILDLGLCPSAESDARFDDIKAYCNSRYALSL